MSIKATDLGKRGMDFVKSELKGGNFLAEGLRSLALDEGFVYTFLPEFVDPEEVSLQWGGLTQIWPGVREAKQKIVSLACHSYRGCRTFAHTGDCGDAGPGRMFTRRG